MLEKENAESKGTVNELNDKLDRMGKELVNKDLAEAEYKDRIKTL